MRTIEATATVTPDGKLTIDAPADIEPGEYQIVVVIDENQSTQEDMLDLEAEFDPEELADLKAAIAISDEEDARGFYITEDQVRQKFADMIAQYKDNHSDLTFRDYQVTPEPPETTFRREEIYGDDGR